MVFTEPDGMWYLKARRTLKMPIHPIERRVPHWIRPQTNDVNPQGKVPIKW